MMIQFAIELESLDMQVIIKKWGNCAAVRLPAAIVKSANLAVDQPVEVEEANGVITLRPVTRRRTLAELIALTPSFEGVPGWADMPAVGREREAFEG